MERKDHGGKWQQNAKGRDGGRREGGRRRRVSGGEERRVSGGEAGRGGGGEGKGRKRAKAAHVYFDDSEEEKETPAKKQRGEGLKIYLMSCVLVPLCNCTRVFYWCMSTIEQLELLL